jgi:hypothetical protein
MGALTKAPRSSEIVTNYTPRGINCHLTPPQYTVGYTG